MSTDDLSREFKELYDAWGDAIANKKYDWFERHFAEDFHGTAQPWPTVSVNKQQMIELDKNIETMDVRWLQVTARKFGETVLVTGVVHYMKEAFREGATLGGNMPSGSQLSELVNGKNVLYIGGWRHNGNRWQIFDHHMIGLVNGVG